MEFITALRGTFDEQKPSLFELLSEEQLSSLLPPTVRYLLTVATQRYPRYLLRPLNSFDELYALCQLVVERHYLLTRGGSFTEHFYGLKRERSLRNEIPRASVVAPDIVKDALNLSRADVWRNLGVMVLVPYLKRKLDEGYAINAPRALLGVAYTRMPDNPTWKQRMVFYYRWFLRNIYPSVNGAYYFAVLAFNLAYLFDNAKAHHPFLWLIGTRIRRMTQADNRALQELANKTSGAAPGPRSFFHPRNLGTSVLSGLSVALPMSIFALKFLEWWHASDFAKQLTRKAAENIELPPPVIPEEVPDMRAKKKLPRNEIDTLATAGSAREERKSEGEEPSVEATPIATPSMLPIYTVSTPEDSSLCPICLDEVATATACQTGIVYCYSCIHRWIEGTHPKQEAFMEGRKGRWESGIGRCAVTGRRVLGNTEGLRRIMI